MKAQKAFRQFSPIIAACLMLAACGPEVTSVEPMGEARTYAESRSCSKPGFCYKCGLDWEGEFSCGFRFSAFCSGSHEVTVVERPTLINYSDGTSKHSSDKRVIAENPCK